MKTIHWSAIGVFFAGLAGVVATLHNWNEIVTPVGVAAILAQLGAFFTALFVSKPGDDSSLSTGAKSLVILALVGLGGVGLSSCASTTQVPNLPQISASADKDVRASIARAYEDIGATLNVLDKTEAYEAKLNTGGAVPAAVHKAFGTAIIAAVQKLDAINTDIKSGALKTYEAIKARVDPVLADLNNLLQLTKSGGFDWGGLLSAGIALLMDITNPGFGGGAPLAQ